MFDSGESPETDHIGDSKRAKILEYARSTVSGRNTFYILYHSTNANRQVAFASEIECV